MKERSAWKKRPEATTGGVLLKKVSLKGVHKIQTTVTESIFK